VLDHALHHLQGDAQLEMDGGFRIDALGGGLCALRIGCGLVAGVCVKGRSTSNIEVEERKRFIRDEKS
jgi:hypothetical protein